MVIGTCLKKKRNSQRNDETKNVRNDVHNIECQSYFYKHIYNYTLIICYGVIQLECYNETSNTER